MGGVELLEVQHEAESERLVEVVRASLGITTAAVDPRCWGVGIEVCRTERCKVYVVPMIVNWRVVEVEINSPMPSGRYWCFEGRSMATFLVAVNAAARYAGAADSEPAGWIKAWDGRYQ